MRVALEESFLRLPGERRVVRRYADPPWQADGGGLCARRHALLLDRLGQLRCTRKLIVPVTLDGATSILQSPVGPDSVFTVPVSFRFR